MHIVNQKFHNSDGNANLHKDTHVDDSTQIIWVCDEYILFPLQ
jgi:hypothetical protein